MNNKAIMEQGEGILRLTPTWVPRAAYLPGRRLKLHPNDLYALGANRGGINTRWLSSTISADNGPAAPPDEGMSYVVYSESGNYRKILLRDLIADLGADVLGEDIWDKYHRWPILGKLFDFKGSLPHHLHLMPEHAALVGLEPKPEGYYFPYQQNNYGADFPYTYFGLEPGTTREQVRHCLEIWDQGDNQITNLSRAYRLELSTGWVLPAGVLHAPGSLVTYEPQWASDVAAVFQSLVNNVPMPWSSVVKDVPKDKHGDLDYLVSLLDWEINPLPNFKEKYFRRPLPVYPLENMKSDGYIEHWVSYGSEFFAAKELTILPGRTVTINDASAYGLIAMQGHGTFGNWLLETPAMIRFGQFTHDEYFVSHEAAKRGVRIHNPSESEPIVMLKHFAPNPEAPRL